MKVICEATKHFVSSFRNSLRGISVTLGEESAFRQECLLVVPHCVLWWFFNLSLWNGFLLTVFLVLVFIVELLNTAIENVVDLASPDYHELAKKAKDAASAAVFFSLALYAMAWGVIIVKG